jgi:hypothetical protein
VVVLVWGVSAPGAPGAPRGREVLPGIIYGESPRPGPRSDADVACPLLHGTTSIDSMLDPHAACCAAALYAIPHGTSSYLYEDTACMSQLYDQGPRFSLLYMAALY